MLNKKAAKNHVKGLNFRTGQDALELLERKIELILSSACEFAIEDRRKTINAMDVERAIKYEVKKGG